MTIQVNGYQTFWRIAGNVAQNPTLAEKEDVVDEKFGIKVVQVYHEGNMNHLDLWPSHKRV